MNSDKKFPHSTAYEYSPGDSWKINMSDRELALDALMESTKARILLTITYTGPYTSEWKYSVILPDNVGNE